MTEVSLCRSVASLPPTARDRKPTQVQCCTWLKTAREQLSPGRFPSRSLPPGNSHSRVPWPLLAIPDAPPRCVAHRARSASVPPAARDRKPNQVQCCTWLKTAQEEYSRRAKKKPSHKAELFLWNPATSYSPGRFQPCCFAHRARTTGNLAKYNACTHPQMAGSWTHCRAKKK